MCVCAYDMVNETFYDSELYVLLHSSLYTERKQKSQETVEIKKCGPNILRYF